MGGVSAVGERAEKAAEAARLREQGLIYREIAERMGLSSVQEAWNLVNYEKSKAQVRAYKARNREALREYDKRYSEENRAVCPHCGFVYGLGSARISGKPQADVNFSNCSGCRRERGEQIVVAWDLGWTLNEIAEWLGWTRGHLGMEFDRLRAEGYDLPYRNRHHKNPPKFAERVAA